jgi:ketosteroid isomerase-like protein
MGDEDATDPRVATVFRTLEAYARGDLQAMQQTMALDVTLEAVGNNPMAGTYEGLGGVMAFIGKSMATFVPGSVSVEQVEPTDDEVRVVVKGEMALVDDTTASVRILQRYWFGEDGKVSKIRAELAADPEGFDRLLREQARRL